MKQSSTRQTSSTDAAAEWQARAPAQAMADQRPSAAVQRQQVAAMQGSAATVAQQQRADGMAAHTGHSLAQGGAGALQLKAAEGQGVAQLGLLDWLKDKFGRGKDAKRKLDVKKEKLSQEAQDAAMGVYHGGSVAGRYTRMGAPTERQIENRMLNEESAGRERMKERPVQEIGRMAVNGLAGAGISAGKEALNAVAPFAGTAVGKIAGKGMEKVDKRMKKEIEKGLNPYGQLEDEDEVNDEAESEGEGRGYVG